VFRRFKAWLKGPSRSQPFADAQARRTEALRLLERANPRDTRLIGRLRMELAAATTAELAEVVWK
jgi:hypothetical protein